jgi:hypothetical protein
MYIMYSALHVPITVVITYPGTSLLSRWLRTGLAR